MKILFFLLISIFASVQSFASKKYNRPVGTMSEVYIRDNDSVYVYGINSNDNSETMDTFTSIYNYKLSLYDFTESYLDTGAIKILQKHRYGIYSPDIREMQSKHEQEISKMRKENEKYLKKVAISLIIMSSLLGAFVTILIRS